MATFQKVKLGDLMVKVTDGSHWSPQEQKSGIPMASVKDMTEFGFDIDKCKKITKEDYIKIERADCKPLINDILIAKDGSYLKYAFVWKKEEKLAILSSIAILRPDTKKINPYYFSKILTTNNVKKKMANYVTGSALPRIVLKDFKKMEFEIPDLPTQTRIASVLSAYDDLIENNEKRIKALEEMAQLLYTEWFVKFKFPGHEKVKMVESGTEYGMVPEGWEVKKLGEIANLTMGQSPTSDNYNLENSGLPFHQGVADFGHKYPIDRVYSTAGNKYAESGDLLFSVRAPVGRMNIASKKIIIGRGLSAIRHKKGFQSILYLMFVTKFTEKDMIGNGAIYKSVNKAELENLQFVVATDGISRRFEEIISLCFHEMEKLTASNLILSKTRDLLIPQLVTGKRELR